ncbi:DUF4112 domain-containing protein [Salinigranum salinum]|uniref:DUF4112 domain-containing protein n=1 Tax=Salinigranum salinum TaxID=1364937 RepID=UPI0012606AEC|nr:DUF4112 domain-containing protein [Salinigranum salinum]
MHDPTRDLDDAFTDDLAVELPPTVDEAAVRRMASVSRLLDESVRIPGTEFDVGLDPLLSALPGNVGDAVGAGLSLYIVLESARLGVSFTTLVRMLANIAIDVAVGSVPVVGVLFDALWKANVRNVELALEDLADAAAQSAVPEDGDDADAVTIEVE